MAAGEKLELSEAPTPTALAQHCAISMETVLQSLLGSCLSGPAPCQSQAPRLPLLHLTSKFSHILQLSVTIAEAADSREASVLSPAVGRAHRGPEVKPGHQH